VIEKINKIEWINHKTKKWPSCHFIDKRKKTRHL